ncbi:MAG: hypothetical protein M1503_04230 [Thaumarchaeota archaeon]|nr:hypothetical protein [Nitrososphaerota archaeon]MCL5317460.1 hypothetical protein [Nitrososphaerota archaeon]
MIRIKVLGSLGKRLGGEIFTFNQNSVELAAALKTVYGIEGEAEVDYSELLSSVLVAVNGVAISGDIGVVLESGDEVTLIPVSHGG